MRLDRVDITNLRNLEHLRLTDLGHANVLFGANGSGKTSILEALYTLGVARSFRSRRMKSVISHGQPSCTVYAEQQPQTGSPRQTIGVTRDTDAGFQIRINGRSISSTAELAAHIPVLCLNADSFNLFLSGPGTRRKYLDWSVFHVEHDFYPAWKKYHRCIKQRNSLLRRDKLQRESLIAWTAELAHAGEVLNEHRRSHFEGLQPLFTELATELSDSLRGLELSFNRGWDSRQSLIDVLSANEISDFDRGFTQAGPHRADIKIRLDGLNAADVLSRGQMKLAVCALTLAQGELLRALTGRACLYLVDDLPSELDEHHRVLFCSRLAKLGSQVFVTCVDRSDIVPHWPNQSELAMFHVEHGKATRVENNL